jgi:hypothetical protein
VDIRARLPPDSRTGRGGGDAVKRRSTTSLAARSAFRRSIARFPDNAGNPVTTRVRALAQAFVAGFPALVGAPMVLFAIGGRYPDATALYVGATLLLGAVALLILGLRSRLTFDDDSLSVRFYGIRATTVRIDEVETATFAMLFPSISYAITLTDRHGRRARIHANWWRDEARIMPPICRRLVARDVAMDRMTARVVSQVLRIKRPKPRIVHHAVLRRDRTW